jgi:telomeric repeat-binding factor 2-interacting protein 1
LTSGVVAKASEALKYLSAGKAVPENVPGIWTQEDDKIIQGTDAREMKRMSEKHGSDGPGGLEARMEFLMQ